MEHSTVPCRCSSLKNLDKYLSNNKNKVNVTDISNNLALAGIGGRVCYAKNGVDWKDERINKGLIDYLDKLSKQTHFSVFAHVPVRISVSKEMFMEMELYNLFKAIYNPKEEILYLNLRHLLEAHYYGKENPKLSSVIQDYLNINPKEFKYTEGYYLDVNILGNITYIQPNNFWFFVYLKDVTNPMAVHILRHVSLNFNARSFRYTKLGDNARLPEDLRKGLLDKYNTINEGLIEKAEKIGNDLYKTFKDEAKFSAEDARFFSLQGFGTNMVISGFLNDLNYIIDLRTKNSNQSFTRNIFNKIKQLKESTQ